MLNHQETKRYSRHILLPEIGIEGQTRLKQAKILVIGAGGLGCPILQYLTAAGVGTIGIVEFDTVDESNLQRQILYTIHDIRKPKIHCAIQKLSEQNPFVNFIAHPVQITNKNALDIIKSYDVVIDGSDNFATRYMINDACVILNKPLVYGSINRFEGQLTVFNLLHKNGKRGPTYRCLFPEPPSPESAPSCSEVGVIGVLPGIIGSMQASETIKIITQAGEPLSGKLFMLNTLNMEHYTVSFNRNEEAATAINTDEFENTDYDYFCNTSSKNEQEITVTELKELLQNSRDAVQLIDVRDNGELPLIEELTGVKIPLAEILNQSHKIDGQKKVIIYCKSGARSAAAIVLLKKEKNITGLYNLKGGTDEWLKHQHKA